jgi:hypothetical protein
MLSKQKSAGNISLIPDSSYMGKQSVQYIRKPETVEFKNTALDSQSLSENLNAISMSDKVKWYMPSAEVEKVFGVLDSQMDII